MHSQGWRDWTGGAQRPGILLEGQLLQSPKTMGTQSCTEPRQDVSMTPRNTARKAREKGNQHIDNTQPHLSVLRLSALLCVLDSPSSLLCVIKVLALHASSPLFLFASAFLVEPPLQQLFPGSPLPRAALPDLPGTPASQLVRPRGSNTAKTLEKQRRSPVCCESPDNFPLGLKRRQQLHKHRVLWPLGVL